MGQHSKVSSQSQVPSALCPNPRMEDSLAQKAVSGSTPHLESEVKSLSSVQLFATPWNGAPPDSSVRGIFQARIRRPWENKAETAEQLPLDSTVPCASFPLSPGRQHDWDD